MPPAGNAKLWTDSFLDEMAHTQDPRADAFVEQLLREEGQLKAKELFDWLISNVALRYPHLPDWAEGYFQETAQLPPWANPQLIEQGQEFFAEHGPGILSILFFKSLPSTYLLRRGARILHLTGRLDGSEEKLARFARRIAETAQFVLDVMTPGYLQPGGRGIETAQKIRLIHASIRQFVPQEHWDPVIWDRPVNQEDMAFTLYTFSVSILEGLEHFGVEVREADRKAYLHAWRVVGHLLGLREELLTESFEEAQALMDKILLRQATESEAGMELTEALVHFGKEMTPGRRIDNLIPLMMRFLLGDKYSEMLGVQTQSGCLAVILPQAIRTSLGILTRLDQSQQPVGLLFDHLNQMILHNIVPHIRSAKGQGLDVDADLKARWELREG